MFVKAIEKVGEFTRPIHTISRTYGSNVVLPGAATLFFINEFGHAITCKHVADIIVGAKKINQTYNKFKGERASIPQTNKYNRKLKDLEKNYGYNQDVTAQIKNNFINCIDKMSAFVVEVHPSEDLALIKFEGFEKLLYKNYATFVKYSSSIKQGKMLCRLGYPFPEFSNFKYNSDADDLEWVGEGKQDTPRFPIEGMVTRNFIDKNKKIVGIELSTPGLRGQSGGPLFDQEGFIYGMQSMTHHLHLGFDIKEKEIREGNRTRKVSNYPFLHLGKCVHADVIKDFLKEKNIKFYESEQ